MHEHIKFLVSSDQTSHKEKEIKELTVWSGKQKLCAHAWVLLCLFLFFSDALVHSKFLLLLFFLWVVDQSMKRRKKKTTWVALSSLSIFSFVWPGRISTLIFLFLWGRPGHDKEKIRKVRIFSFSFSGHGWFHFSPLTFSRWPEKRKEKIKFLFFYIFLMSHDQHFAATSWLPSVSHDSGKL